MTEDEISESRRKNNVQVGSTRSNFVYCDLAKHLLAGGEPEVEISALGKAIADAVSVVEMLKNQGMVSVVKLYTCRGEEAAGKRRTTDKISITVAKSPDFDRIYAEQQSKRQTRASPQETE